MTAAPQAIVEKEPTSVGVSSLPTAEETIRILLAWNCELIRRYSPALSLYSDEEIEALGDETYAKLLQRALDRHHRRRAG